MVYRYSQFSRMLASLRWNWSINYETKRRDNYLNDD